MFCSRFETEDEGAISISRNPLKASNSGPAEEEENMKKTMTPNALEANRVNGKKAAGATTERGKLAASRNAITHGYFCRELALADNERREIEKLRHDLRKQLRPATALREVAFARILACVPRCMLALRMEMRPVSKVLDGADDEPGEPEGAAPNNDWYLAGKAELRQSMRLLQDLGAEFQQSGKIDPKWERPLDSVFGVGFRQLLTQWIPANPSAAALAHMLTRHERVFKRPLPPLEKAPADGSSAQPAPKTCVGPGANEGDGFETDRAPSI